MHLADTLYPPLRVGTPGLGAAGKLVLLILCWAVGTGWDTVSAQDSPPTAAVTPTQQADDTAAASSAAVGEQQDLAPPPQAATDAADSPAGADPDPTAAEDRSSQDGSEGSQPPPADEDASVETESSIELDPLREEEESQHEQKCIIGATATIMEKKSELVFRARVDSGAKSCSLHVDKISIENEADTMRENIGKVISFRVQNGESNERRWLKSKIASYVIIKTSSSRERRYKVPLTFQWKHLEKKVLVTLNDRNSMEYPLLLGRNFLRGDFLVDVELDSDD